MINEKIFPETPYSIKSSTIPTKPGCWNYKLIEIFKNNIKIGEYTRKYSGFALNTFYPFKHKDRWYALYSADYTATRVALIEEKFEDWCGEEGFAHGFCPVEFYVPKAKYNKCYSWTDYEAGIKLEEKKKYFYDSYVWDNESDYDQENLAELKEIGPDEQGTGITESKITYGNFGFLSGCIWGDDSSWKLRFIDFSELENKILKITEKFGYFELPGSLELKECIVLTDLTGLDGKYIILYKQKYFGSYQNSKNQLKYFLKRDSVKSGEEILLSSGKTSNLYINCKNTILKPGGHKMVGEVLNKFIFDNFDNEINTVIGVPSGGNLLASALSSINENLNMLIIRKEEKSHGIITKIEGLLESKQEPKENIILLEDVVTTGKSVLEAIKILKEAGFIIDKVLTLVDRQEGGKEFLLNEGIKLYSIFTKEELLT